LERDRDLLESGRVDSLLPFQESLVRELPGSELLDGSEAIQLGLAAGQKVWGVVKLCPEPLFEAWESVLRC
jgi:hypothetical protein